MAWGPLGLGTPTDLFLPLLVPPQIQVGDSVAAAPFVDMVVAALRHAPLVVLVVLQLYAAGAGGAEAPATEGPCSKALGFNESEGPKDRSGQDLQFCTEHHKRTCCERNRTRQVLTSWTSFAHERSARCGQMSRLALCSACDGDVGAGLKSQQNLIVLCPSFCLRWYQSCLEDFFAPSGSGQLGPCVPGSLVCSPLREITEDSAGFCDSIGEFATAQGEDELDSCYDGVPAAMARGKGPRAAWERPQPARKPWWRRFLPSSRRELLWRVEEVLQDYKAMLVATTVSAIFGWYIWRSAD